MSTAENIHRRRTRPCEGSGVPGLESRVSGWHLELQINDSKQKLAFRRKVPAAN